MEMFWWIGLAIVTIVTTAIVTVLPLKGGWQMAIIFGGAGIFTGYWLFANLVEAGADRGLIYSFVAASVSLTIVGEMFLYAKRRDEQLETSSK